MRAEVQNCASTPMMRMIDLRLTDGRHNARERGGREVRRAGRVACVGKKGRLTDLMGCNAGTHQNGQTNTETREEDEEICTEKGCCAGVMSRCVSWRCSKAQVFRERRASFACPSPQAWSRAPLIRDATQFFYQMSCMICAPLIGPTQSQSSSQIHPNE